MNKIVTAMAASFMVATVTAPAHADVILFEDFETDGNGTRYTTSVPEFNMGTDFFTRTDFDDVDPRATDSLSGWNGEYWFGAMDVDRDPFGGAPQKTLNFLVDVSGFENLQLSLLIAEDDDLSRGTDDWDSSDFVIFEASIDGGDYQSLLDFQSLGGGSSKQPALDTNGDGDGDGTILTNMFMPFAADIDGTGSVMDLRITFNLGGGDEDIALDDIQLVGDATLVPVPAAVWLFSSGLLMLVGAARRKSTS